VERDRVLREFRGSRDIPVHEIDVQRVPGLAGDFHGLFVQLRGRPGQRDADREHHVDHTEHGAARPLGSHGNSV